MPRDDTSPVKVRIKSMSETMSHTSEVFPFFGPALSAYSALTNQTAGTRRQLSDYNPFVFERSASRSGMNLSQVRAVIFCVEGEGSLRRHRRRLPAHDALSTAHDEHYYFNLRQLRAR